MTDLRSHVESYIDTIPDNPDKSEKLQTLIDRALGSQKKAWVTIDCKHCGRTKKYEVDVPDTAAAIRALRDLIEMTKPKLPQKIEVTQRHTLEDLRQNIHEVPTEELLRLEAEDAEYVDLPALPSPS